MKVEYKVGSAASFYGKKLWFNFIPYLFISSASGRDLVIQGGWLFWDIGLKLTW